MRSFRVLATALGVVISIPAFGLVPPGDTQKDLRWREPKRALGRSEPLDLEAATPSGAAARAFLARWQGPWELRVDRRTGRAALAQGKGIPLVPGHGNSLGPEALIGLPLADGEVGVETLEPLVLAFLEDNRDLVGPASGRLALERETSGPRDGGRLFSFNYRWLLGEVPVEGAGVFVRVNSGNITQFGSILVGDARVVDTTPAFAAEEAARRLLAWSGDDELAHLSGSPRLVVAPEEDGHDRLVYRLVWVVTYRLPGRIETWEGRLDAHNGEILGFRDANHYGRVVGGVYPRTVSDPETRVLFPAMRVDHTSVLSTDTAGAFGYTGGEALAGMNGTFFDTDCQSCTNPPQPGVATNTGIGWLDFGVGGQDAVGNGTSTKADRNSFYHLNQVRRLAKKWFSALGWLDTVIESRVNFQATCNAFYDGAVNFYRSGGGCNNTGEISDVMQHEWGHGLDQHTLPGDGATGEATADIVAMHMTHDARIGPYFEVDGTPVRDLEKNRSGLATRSNIAGRCPPGGGPLGREVHCEGEIYGQTQWDLSQALAAKHGHHTGWRTSERVFFTSLPDAGVYLPESPDAVYAAYVNADDDDGNLANGTPNGTEIYQAFSLHEIAGTPRVSSPGCVRPAQPAPTVTPSCDRFSLSWTSVPGADHYVVLRSEIQVDTAYFPIATVPSGQTSYVDTEVAPATSYAYMVMAVGPSGCESTVENPQPARLPAQPILSVTAVGVDDTPRGNRSGYADPGEEVDLHVTLANFGEVAAGSVSGTILSTNPGVTILDGTDDWSSIPSNGTGSNAGVLRFVTDSAQVLCGDTIRFQLVPDEATGCASEQSYFDVFVGQETSLAAGGPEKLGTWALDPSLSNAATGHWSFGGQGSYWFTGRDVDVDGGMTVLVSPELDLGGREHAAFSYHRSFVNRDPGEDPEDYFKAEASPDGGATWIALEDLGTKDTAPGWAQKRFNLERYIPLTRRVRLRFVVSDGPGAANLIEAAVGGAEVLGFVCDSTPACFVPPNFEGLGSAGPGASCAEAALAWQAATSNCQNATLTYNVYRGTDPGFTPDEDNRVASGLTGTSFTDTLLAPGATYYYVVRAFDSRSGEETNLVRRSVVAPTSPDTAPPAFAGVETAVPGGSCGETTSSWTAAQETCSVPVAYDVHRSTDPSFVPSGATLVATTFSLSYEDAALVPGTAYTYVVRARDSSGNVETNLVRRTLIATILDRVLVTEPFEASEGGWSTIAPNDAQTGRWEWGDPQGTQYQPEDDHTPTPGSRCWVTGLAAAGGAGGNDIDAGLTTLRSARYDLSAAVDPVVGYARWFTNDRGASPGEDPFRVSVSDDDGATWRPLEQVGAGTPLDWVVVQLDLPALTTPSADMRFRFQAQDLLSGSLVEAAIDDFQIIDRGGGCSGCSQPVPAVGTIFVTRSGDDVVLDWTADPVQATRFIVYKLSGPGLTDAVRIGSTTGRSFVHAAAVLSGEDFYYLVSAVDTCGQESNLR